MFAQLVFFMADTTFKVFYRLGENGMTECMDFCPEEYFSDVVAKICVLQTEKFASPQRFVVRSVSFFITLIFCLSHDLVKTGIYDLSHKDFSASQEENGTGTRRNVIVLFHESVVNAVSSALSTPLPIPKKPVNNKHLGDISTSFDNKDDDEDDEEDGYSQNKAGCSNKNIWAKLQKEKRDYLKIWFCFLRLYLRYRHDENKRWVDLTEDDVHNFYLRLYSVINIFPVRDPLSTDAEPSFFLGRRLC